MHRNMSEVTTLASTRFLRRSVQVALAITAGTLFQLGGMSCTSLGEKVVKGVNPCGTIFNCDPAEYDLLTTDFPDWDIDPTCTIPGQCGSVWPVLPGGGAAQ